MNWELYVTVSAAVIVSAFAFLYGLGRYMEKKHGISFDDLMYDEDKENE